MSRAVPAAGRYEVRRLPPVGAAPALWGAWDRKHDDWVPVPGPDRGPERFTSEERVLTWAAQQTDTTPKNRSTTHA
jgi:hypothetical protein